MSMDATRSKSSKYVFVSFFSAVECAEFELSFNVGHKSNKPVKFQANKVWSTAGIPPMFSGIRGSFSSEVEAEKHLVEQFSAVDGTLHSATPALVGKLTSEFGYVRS